MSSRAWKHERKLPRDNSCSGFDMALANRMVAAGLGNDEIVPILQEHRRRFGQAHPEKVNDARYFARTIARARENSNKEAAQQEAVEVLSDTDSARDEAIKALATRWQIPLTNVQVVTGDPACFRFWIGGRCAVIGAPDMVSQTRFLGEMISVAQVYPLPVGNKEKPGWRDYVNTICRIAERIEAGDDATRDGNFSALLVDFLEERGIEDFPEGTLLPYSIGPFRRDGRLWLRLRDLVQFLRVYDSHVKRGEVVQRLRALGAVAKPHAREGRKAGTSSTAHFYGVEEEKMRSV